MEALETKTFKATFGSDNSTVPYYCWLCTGFVPGEGKSEYARFWFLPIFAFCCHCDCSSAKDRLRALSDYVD